MNANNGLTRRDVLKAGAVLMAGSGLAAAVPAAKGLPFSEYAGFDALGLAQLVRRGDVSALELLEAAIARTEAVNPVLNAVVLRHYDLAREAIARGLPEGPFHGVPFLLKDLGISLRGTVTSEGSRFFRDAVAAYDSTLVERYRAAGLVIFGKSASPEFGGAAATESTLWGPSRNPWNTALTPGGSSGGAAGAVAAGILPIAHATDGGGSIRIPAACCGLFGLKPTRDRIPMGPLRGEGWFGLSIGHAVSRSVRDSAALLDASMGPEPGSLAHAPAPPRPYLEEVGRDPGRLRIALMPRPILDIPVHPDCDAAVRRAAALCESLGHHVEEAMPRLNVEEALGASGTASTVGMLAMVRARERALGRAVTPEDLEQTTWERLQDAQRISADQVATVRDGLFRAHRAIELFMSDYDMILSPTLCVPSMPVGAMSMAQSADVSGQASVLFSAFPMLFNITGQPSMSVPLHWNDDGLPVGVMFTGRFGDESSLFRLAGQLEQAAPWNKRFPRDPLLA